MRHMIRNLATIAALACSTAVPAEAPPAGDDDSEIVIEGVRERERQVQRFVDALTDAPVHGQLARFDWKVPQQ